jgi:hypothetical protein
MTANRSKRQPTAKPVAPENADVTVSLDKSLITNGPRFAEPTTTTDPQKFSVKHGSDSEAYSLLDQMKGKLRPLPFPADGGVAEPVLQLADAYGSQGLAIIDQIKSANQLVFHSLGHTGNTKGPRDQELVADKMVADYDDTDPRLHPSQTGARDTVHRLREWRSRSSIFDTECLSRDSRSRRSADPFKQRRLGDL